MKTNIFIFFLIISTYTQEVKAQVISVDESSTPTQLIENVLLQSSCASVSNVTVSGGNFSSGELSYGSFDANGSSFPFQNGIILSTGKINNAPGPNSYISDDGGSMGWNGDSDLNQALNISNSTNATILEFDFIPLGHQISFDYIFSSEEYHGTATCQYSDGFGFLLKEVGTSTYQNLAVIPNTTTPVKVTSVHPNIPGGCGPQNEQYFDAFNGTNHPTNFNGQTKVLTAQANVTPGTQYHIKLVIADEGNYRYDSAIFLGGGTFNFGVDIGSDRLISTGNPVCQNEATTTNPYILDATYTGATYQWKFNNIDISGATNATLEIPSALVPTLQDGTYSVDVKIGTSCIIPSSIELEFAPILNVNQTTFTLCDNDTVLDGKTTFDLNSIKNQIFSNLPSSYQIAFFETSTSSANLPLSYTNTTAYSQSIFARITNIQGCYNDYPINLVVNTFNQVITNETIGLCDGNSIILDAGNGFTSYNWNTNPTQNSQTISIDTPGTYTVTLENSSGCFKDKIFTVVGSQIALINEIKINDFTSNNSASIITSTGNYEFSLDGINYQDSNVFTNLEAGEYTVYVQDKNGCGITTKYFYILDYPKYFTPNNDGYNDTWQIKNLDKRGFEASKIYIFDRYGKLLKQILPVGNGWDGLFNGEALPSSDYWFILEQPNGKTIRGHFTLKR